MSHYSRTTLRELKKRYLNVLKKCFLLNLMAFSFGLPVFAETITSQIVTESNESVTYSEYLDFSDLMSSSSGGAIYNSSGASITFDKNTTFSSNTSSSYGGAIYNYGTMNFADLAEFKENKANNGGAIYNYGTMNFAGATEFKENESSGSYGGAIYNRSDASITFDKNTTFSSNTSSSYGGAIYNDGTINFDGATEFKENEANNGGAIYNYETMNFAGATEFKENKANNGGAIYNYGTMNFAGATEFKENESSGSYGAIYNRGTITFNDNFHFTGNKNYTEDISFLSIGIETIEKAGDDIYNSRTINFSHGDGKIGTFDGGIYQSNGVINKNGEGTLVLGDQMMNEGQGSFNQSAGLTITGSDTFKIAESNQISGGTLETHGSTIEFNASFKGTDENNKAVWKHYDTGLTVNDLSGISLGQNAEAVFDIYTDDIKQDYIDAYVQEGIENKLFLTDSVAEGTKARYIINQDIAQNGGSATFKNSNVTFTGTEYVGKYHFDESSSLSTINQKSGNVTFENLSGENVGLMVDMGDTINSQNSVSFDLEKVNTAKIVPGLETYQALDGSAVFANDAEFKLDKYYTGLTASVTAGGKDIVITGKMELQDHTYTNLGQMLRADATTDVGMMLDMENLTSSENGVYTYYINEQDLEDPTDTTKSLGTLGSGDKYIVGLTDDANESIIKADEYSLFNIGSNETGTLTVANLTIDGAKNLITVAQDVESDIELNNVIVKNSTDTIIQNDGKLNLSGDVAFVDHWIQNAVAIENDGELTFNGNLKLEADSPYEIEDKKFIIKDIKSDIELLSFMGIENVGKIDFNGDTEFKLSQVINGGEINFNGENHSFENSFLINMDNRYNNVNTTLSFKDNSNISFKGFGGILNTKADVNIGNDVQIQAHSNFLINEASMIDGEIKGKIVIGDNFINTSRFGLLSNTGEISIGDNFINTSRFGLLANTGEISIGDNSKSDVDISFLHNANKNSSSSEFVGKILTGNNTSMTSDFAILINMGDIKTGEKTNMKSNFAFILNDEGNISVGNESNINLNHMVLLNNGNMEFGKNSTVSIINNLTKAPQTNFPDKLKKEICDSSPLCDFIPGSVIINFSNQNQNQNESKMKFADKFTFAGNNSMLPLHIINGNGTMEFGQEANFIGNSFNPNNVLMENIPVEVKKIIDVLGGSTYLQISGNTIFNGDFTFSDNNKLRPEQGLIRSDIMSIGIDSSQPSVVHFSQGDGSVGSIEGGILQGGNAQILKDGAGTFILGDNSINYYKGETSFIQTDGLTIAKTDNLNLAESHVVNGGELKTHGGSIKHAAIVGSINNEDGSVTTGKAMHYTNLEEMEISNETVSSIEIENKNAPLLTEEELDPSMVGIRFAASDLGATIGFGTYTKAEKDAEIALLKGKVISYADDKGTIDPSDDEIVSYLASDKLLTTDTLEEGKRTTFKITGALDNESGNILAFKNVILEIDKDLALNGTGATYELSNSTLQMPEELTITNKVVTNNVDLGGKATEVSFKEIEIKPNSSFNIDNKSVIAEKINFGENSTLNVTLNGLKDFGTLTHETVIGDENANLEIKLTKGLDQDEGVYQIFNKDNKLKVQEPKLIKIVDQNDGSYLIIKKPIDELKSDFELTESEAVVLAAFIDGNNEEHQTFRMMQRRILDAIQSDDSRALTTAKNNLLAIGESENPIEQSVSTEHMIALQNVVQAELRGIGRSGGMNSPRAKVYMKGLYDYTKFNTGAGFKARSKGAVLGVQSKVTENLTIGVGYATSETIAKETLRRIEADTNTGFVTAHYQPNAWWVSGLAMISRAQYDEEKHIFSSKSIANYDVDTWGAQVITGYDVHFDKTVVTPEFGLRYLKLRQEGYTDTLGTTVNAITSEYLTALAGVKTVWNLGGIRPTAGVTVGYDLISDDVNSINTLANGGSYMVQGEALDRLSTIIQLGVESNLGESSSLKLEYSGTFRKEYQDHSGILKLETKF